VKYTIKYMLTASALALLAACGGGYDSGDDAPVAPVTPSGTVTTLAGTPFTDGSADGTGAAASFRGLRAVAVDSSGNVYVADTYSSTIRKITPAGVVTTLAGTPVPIGGEGGFADGTGANALFKDPMGIAVDASGNVYVADTGNQVIRKITIDVNGVATVTTLAGREREGGFADGTGADARFSGPVEIAVDSSGNLYVADSGNVVVRKITPAGVVTTLAGKAGEAGSTDGTGADARFGDLSGIAVDSSGNVYVSESYAATIRKITPAGVVTTLAGTPVPVGENGGFADGTGAAAKFFDPEGVAVDASGNVFVADFNNQSIRKITPAGVVTTFAGGPENRTPGDGVGVGIPMPSGVAVGSDGYIYFVTEANTVGKISP